MSALAPLRNCVISACQWWDAKKRCSASDIRFVDVSSRSAEKLRNLCMCSMRCQKQKWSTIDIRFINVGSCSATSFMRCQKRWCSTNGNRLSLREGIVQSPHVLDEMSLMRCRKSKCSTSGIRFVNAPQRNYAILACRKCRLLLRKRIACLSKHWGLLEQSQIMEDGLRGH